MLSPRAATVNRFAGSADSPGLPERAARMRLLDVAQFYLLGSNQTANEFANATEAVRLIKLRSAAVETLIRSRQQPNEA